MMEMSREDVTTSTVNSMMRMGDDDHYHHDYHDYHRSDMRCYGEDEGNPYYHHPYHHDHDRDRDREADCCYQYGHDNRNNNNNKDESKGDKKTNGHSNNAITSCRFGCDDYERRIRNRHSQYIDAKRGKNHSNDYYYYNNGGSRYFNPTQHANELRLLEKEIQEDEKSIRGIIVEIKIAKKFLASTKEKLNPNGTAVIANSSNLNTTISGFGVDTKFWQEMKQRFERKIAQSQRELHETQSKLSAKRADLSKEMNSELHP